MGESTPCKCAPPSQGTSCWCIAGAQTVLLWEPESKTIFTPVSHETGFATLVENDNSLFDFVNDDPF